MLKILIAACAVAGVAVMGFIARRYWLARAVRKRDEHFAILRGSLGIKGAPDAKVDGEPIPLVPVVDSSRRALILHSDANGLRVNGEWLTRMNLVVEPEPNFGSRKSVEEALALAKRFNKEADSARRLRDWVAADELIRKALDVVNTSLRRDHWYAADVLNQLGCVLYEQGFFNQAREVWSQADQICSDWPTRCAYLHSVVQSNLKRVTDILGF